MTFVYFLLKIMVKTQNILRIFYRYAIISIVKSHNCSCICAVYCYMRFIGNSTVEEPIKRKGEMTMNKLVKTAMSVLTCASVAASLCVSASAAKYSFNDISDTKYDWCAPQIQSMYDKGLVTGYEDNTYRPDNEVTRQECLALFARAMGSREEENKKILEIAHDLYDETITTYGLSWGTDEIAYLMYRGTLKKADLDTYLKDDEKGKPMKRYEASIIITKAMGGEDVAATADTSNLDYADADTIPANAKGYVQYAMEEGIMTGMDGNRFSPLTSVSRSQIAVMLSRTVEATDYSFVSAKLNSIDTNARTYVVKHSDGTMETEFYNENTIMNSMGIQTIPANMVVGVAAIFTYSGDEIVYIDAISETPDETVVGRFMSSGTSNNKIYVNVIPTGETKQKSYTCAADVSILFAGSPATMRSFSKDDSVELEIVDGVVTTVIGNEKSYTIQGAIVEDISIDPSLEITISHADDAYDGMVYSVNNSVTVKKNGATSDFSSIYTGDTVALTLEYGQVVKVVATSKSTKTTGTIKSITISSTPTMIVNVGGQDREFMIPNDIAIKINGSEGTLYDFRVGDSVTLTIESDAITAITATSTQITSGEIVGVVTAINASYGFITVQADDGTSQTVFCKDLKTTFITSAGKDTKMSAIKEGDVVDARGTVSNGAFVATLVIVTPSAN